MLLVFFIFKARVIFKLDFRRAANNEKIANSPTIIYPSDNEIRL